MIHKRGYNYSWLFMLLFFPIFNKPNFKRNITWRIIEFRILFNLLQQWKEIFNFLLQEKAIRVSIMLKADGKIFFYDTKLFCKAPTNYISRELKKPRTIFFMNETKSWFAFILNVPYHFGKRNIFTKIIENEACCV